MKTVVLEVRSLKETLADADRTRPVAISTPRLSHFAAVQAAVDDDK